MKTPTNQKHMFAVRLTGEGPGDKIGEPGTSITIHPSVDHAVMDGAAPLATGILTLRAALSWVRKNTAATYWKWYRGGVVKL
ncbi:MAG TPA: hypothetical protein VFE51_29710 [Verrucomicrobiae bacterium]|nr:hypothetical protein [Verrucomicrobiae bacterium]